MMKPIILLVIMLTSSLAAAQFIKEKSVNAQIGLGLSSPNTSVDEIVDDGFFAQGDLVLTVAS